ncbi:MAG: hypothetical protein U1C50_01275 [Patescibacteria group bacterium]|nr:hypothetical protein [Patescibacteria group bacterium]MDP4030966.1 hypothetical protein [Candidatus Beckwithbacteria bacterium]MDZ4228868.1 hypothetical protein [Patescibacteria group bacterium]
MDKQIPPAKYAIMFLSYLWLRFDLALRLAFGSNWKSRYEFMAQIFGAEDTEKFLAHRVKLVLHRRREQIPIILPSDVARLTRKFLRSKITSKTGRKDRLAMINKLIFWVTDPEINKENIDSYKTRSTIINALLNVIFHNSLFKESETILNSLAAIVFSRITYQGHKGEPSPEVHDVILTAVSQLLIRHFSEIVRLRDQRVDKLTTIQLIRELNKAKAGTGSLSFSGEVSKKQTEYHHKFPLSARHVYLLYQILEHYTFSAWPDSREKAISVVSNLESQLKTSLKTLVESTKDSAIIKA